MNLFNKLNIKKYNKTNMNFFNKLNRENKKGLEINIKDNTKYLTSYFIEENNLERVSKTRNNVQKQYSYNYNQEKYNSPSSKEWSNSVYYYNKNNEKTVMYKSKISDFLIESYLNLQNNANNHLKKYRWYRNKKYFSNYFSLNRIHVSKTEMKHTNYNVTISLYFYDIRTSIKMKNLDKFRTVFYNLNDMLPFFFEKKNRLKSATEKSSHLRKRVVKLTKKYFISNLYRLLKSCYKHLWKKKNNNFLSKFRTIVKSEKKVINIKKEVSYLSRYQSIIITKFKSTNWFSNYNNIGLVNMLTNLYNKAIDLNMIKQKSIHLNSEIFTKCISIKLKDRKNRVVRILRKALLKIKFPSLFKLSKRINNNYILKKTKNKIIKSLKYKLINGVRFEAAGRLTRRLTASRAIFKVRYVGSLKNIYSSVEGNSCSMMRGHVKPNLQYTLINSKTANGSFGLKGWLNNF